LDSKHGLWSANKATSMFDLNINSKCQNLEPNWIQLTHVTNESQRNDRASAPIFSEMYFWACKDNPANHLHQKKS
jgi:hypothetical protein